MTRYGFTIKTRHGQRVESIQIMAVTPADAERRLRIVGALHDVAGGLGEAGDGVTDGAEPAGSGGSLPVTGSLPL